MNEHEAARRKYLEAHPEVHGEVEPFIRPRSNGGDAAKQPIPEPQQPALKPFPAVKDDHEIANDLFKLLGRFIAAEESALRIIAIWVLHTWLFLETCSYTPYMVATSAEKGSGKSTVLSVLKWVVRMPLKTSSISPAALARVVEVDRPTILLDEYDIQLNPKINGEAAGLLRGILNDGFHVDGSYTRMVGTSANMHPKSFSTFCPKALAGIGELSDTIASRSLIVRLKRAQRGQYEPFRPAGKGEAAKQLREELERLRIRTARWAEGHVEQIANCEPVCPAQVTDRQRDISEPLLAICEALGGEWPARITNSLAAIFTSPAAEDTSKRVVLLGHIRKVFLDKYDNHQYDDVPDDKRVLRTEDLVAALCAIEDAPWNEWNRGDKINGYGLSRLLKDFEIGPRQIRDPAPCRGYKMSQFRDAFDRYLPLVCLCENCKCHEACNGSCSGSEHET
jgi:hypothetical protein